MKLTKRITKAAKIVKSSLSLGPAGGTVLIRRGEQLPFYTRDGELILRNLTSSQPTVNMALEIIKQSSYLTNEQCGDGTTTTAVLCSSFYLNSLPWLKLGISPVFLLPELENCIELLLENLHPTPISSEKDLEDIATISANGDRKLGQLMAKTILNIGKDGSILVEGNSGRDTIVNFVEGFRVPSGFVSSAFINNSIKNLCQYEDAFVLVSNFKFERASEFLPVLELVSLSKKPLLIVAEDFVGDALNALVLNAQKGTIKVAAIKAPFYGEERESVLADLAIFLNATFVDKGIFTDLGKIKLTDLGHAKTIEIKKNITTIVGGFGDLGKIQDRIAQIKEQVKEAELEDAKRLQERISRLASSIAIVKVGGSSEIEIFQKKLQIDDCIGSLRSAKEEGIILGGGVSLINALSVLGTKNDMISNAALSILKESIYDLIRLLAQGSTTTAEEIIQKMGGEFGYDFMRNKFCNMKEEGIIEPVKNIKCAIRNSFSVVSALLMSKVGIVKGV